MTGHHKGQNKGNRVSKKGFACGIGVLAGLAIASVAANYSAIASTFTDEPVVTADDPVAERGDRSRIRVRTWPMRLETVSA